jgi:hypothetical protein
MNMFRKWEPQKLGVFSPEFLSLVAKYTCAGFENAVTLRINVEGAGIPDTSFPLVGIVDCRRDLRFHARPRDRRTVLLACGSVPSTQCWRD